MSLLESIRTALASLAANRVRSFLTMLGVIIGVASVILLVSVGQGATDYVVKQFEDLGTDLLFVWPTGAHGSPAKKFRLEDARALERRATSVREVSGYATGGAQASAGNRRMDVQLRGVTPAFQRLRNLSVASGSYITESDVVGRRRIAVIGPDVATELFGAANPLGRWIRIEDTRFRVTGVMQTAGRSFGQNPDELVYLPLPALQELFALEGVSTLLATRSADATTEQAEADITAVLSARRGGRQDFEIESQSALLDKFTGITDALKYTLAAIASISLVVGGIGIMNIMLVSVRERTREIGIRKAVGARKKDVLMQFLIESVLLSLIGGAIGIAIGTFGAEGVHQAYPVLPTRTTSWSIVLSFVFSFAVGIFFGVYPAKKAADLDPIEALRSD